jgi:hypothetical protein
VEGAIRQLLWLLAMPVFLTSPAWAQQSGTDIPRVEIFAGFSCFRAGISNGENLFGWQANPDINFTKNIALAMDFGGQYKKIGGITFSMYEYMAGPRFKYRTDRLTAFVHGLVGGEAAHALGFTQGAFALGFGGGLDINAGDSMAFRAFQIDSIHDHSRGSWGHNLRIGIGLVVKLGKS